MVDLSVSNFVTLNTLAVGQATKIGNCHSSVPHGSNTFDNVLKHITGHKLYGPKILIMNVKKKFYSLLVV